MALFLVRHGQTTANAKGLFYGSTDLELTETGMAQAQQIGSLLKNVEFESVYCSGLQRTQQTASAILQLPIRTQLSPPNRYIDPRLNELDFGDWEMRHYQEIAQHDPQSWQSWITDWQQAIPTGGESFQHFAARVSEYAQQLRTEATAGHQLIVAHQGVLRLILTQLLDMPVASMWHFSFQHNAYSVVENNSGFAVLRILNGQMPYQPEIS
ncbi:MAG: adenosylcobalamin/alpha-ribazole phosphatase [Enterobacteriaceae bacterium]|jgi:alpha-ribazole phosphatase|nr:adenosylcobalamin/alpha-ribazole phosphatase [Enterobacteriaceae bacterium]